MPSKNKERKYRLTKKGKDKVENDMFSIKNNDEKEEEKATMIVCGVLYELKTATPKELSEKTGIKITSIGAVIGNGLKSEEIEITL